MALETVPLGKVSNGQALVLFVPTIANPAAPTIAELTAGTVKKITYSATGDGYKHTRAITKVRANRFTLAQEIQYDGTVVDDVTITYAYTNTAGDVVRLALTKGVSGFLVERWAVDNSVAIAAAQIVHVIPITASESIPDAPVKDQELTRTLVCNVSGTVLMDVAVAA
ncbi:hypothetical protein B7R22_05350 [Subtercola boreus]|uniref:Uncharacterized protein n=1 Tax=Subtercola boreus TaxID=120213 RepID=A0A3E0W0E2_9MICO|nr:hypothetical protein [Subtercola boreus]RFA15834.1 hypothetical protein B7R22_05350 [Subtercola boreus]